MGRSKGRARERERDREMRERERERIGGFSPRPKLCVCAEAGRGGGGESQSLCVWGCAMHRKGGRMGGGVGRKKVEEEVEVFLLSRRRRYRSGRGRGRGRGNGKGKGGGGEGVGMKNGEVGGKGVVGSRSIGVCCVQLCEYKGGGGGGPFPRFVGTVATGVLGGWVEERGRGGEREKGGVWGDWFLHIYIFCLLLIFFVWFGVVWW